MERCVANQTLKDKSCAIPCTGLYADIADDSPKQTLQAFDKNVMKGKCECVSLPFHPYILGFHLLTHELRYGVFWNYDQSESKERLYAALQQMFPMTSDETVDEVKSLTESYHKYKHEYAKHICFNPQEENLSK